MAHKIYNIYSLSLSLSHTHTHTPDPGLEQCVIYKDDQFIWVRGTF